MSRIDWACLGAFILGFILFVVGANIQLWGGTSVGKDVTPIQGLIVGDTGLYLSIGSIMVYLVIYIYKEFTKKPMPSPQTPAVQNP